MNNIKPSILFMMLATTLCCACEQEKPANQPLTLEGSWSLEKYIPSGHTEWKSYGDTIIYQKHLSPDHFTWFMFDSKNDEILGMGGGSYAIAGDKYIENIEFFFPPGSNEHGQAIPFSFKLTDKGWHHVGYSKSMAVDMESGKLEMIDSTRIEEVWVKTTIPPSNNLNLVGTWDLIAYRDSLNGEYIEYPDFVGYMKLLTPTHFTWIYYDKYGDEIYAAGSGRYTFDGTNYTEAVDMMYPDNFGQRGSTIQFQTRIDHTIWQHVGYLPDLSIDHVTGHITSDSSLIDERWKLHEASVMDGIIF